MQYTSRGLLLALSLGAASCTLLTSVSGLSGGDGLTGAVVPLADAGATRTLDGAPPLDAGVSAPLDPGVEAGAFIDAPAVDATPAPTTQPFGDGHDGVVAIAGTSVQVNTYLRLAADVPAGASSIMVAGGTLTPGARILLWQVTGYPLPPASTQTLTLGANGVGAWELVRVATFSGLVATLTSPVQSPAGYTAAGAQVVVTPEYTDVNIAAGATVVAKPWDGQTGGIVAFLATGTVTNGGTISADFAGFRGGVGVAANVSECPSTADGATASGFAAKGEGISTPTAPGGRGPAANGAGGGNCSESGGAGGGHAGSGGTGGTSNAGASVGGVGGDAVSYSLLDHLVLGGGGGAGQIDVYTRPNQGGDGGGVVLVQAGTFTGGQVSARGDDALVDVDNGGSGGGAGGAIAIRVHGALTCSGTATSGGAGSTAYDVSGNPSQGAGPGGGGGGGQVLLQGASVGCPTDVSGGAAGHDGARGATNGTAGRTEAPPASGP